MKWDGTSTTALKVVPRINALVSFRSEPRASKDATSGVIVITHNVFLPLVGVTLVRTFTGAGGVRPTLSGTLLEGRLADTLSIGGGVTVRAGKVTGIALGTNRARVVGVVATVPCRYQAGNVVRDLWSANDRGGRVENRIGVAKVWNP